MNWILRDVRIYTPTRVVEGDAWIAEGRWAVLGRVPAKARGRTFLAGGALLLPGLIDTHVHFREPGYTHKGTFYTESRAALAGGVTTAFDMPNTSPPITTLDRWQAKQHALAGRSWVNFGLYFGATEENLSEIRQLDPCQVPGVKVFLASSTGELLVEDEAAVRRLLRESPVRLVFHSEKEAYIRAAQAKWADRNWDTAPDLHLRVRPPEACIESTRWLLAEAPHAQVPLHILHITTQAEVELLAQRPAHVSAETCPIYLTWSAEDFPSYRNRLKCNPSLKSKADQEALWRGLAQGTLEAVGTDHAPHLLAEKAAGYWQAPSGAPAMGYLLPWLWSLGQRRGLPLEFWLEKMVYAPARLWQLSDRGPLVEGYWADAVLFDPHGETAVPPDLSPIHYGKCQWSPLAGHTLSGQVRAVWVNGVLSFHAGVFYGAPAGRPVALGR